nr:putative ribonuclease H-like domain-containing protein [Tanacetum cinerariifolium]
RRNRTLVEAARTMLSAAKVPLFFWTEASATACFTQNHMNTFYQRYPSKHRWTKDHPLEQVIGNPLQSVRTRRQLESDAEMCMFALTHLEVSLIQPSSNEPFQAPHNPPSLEPFINGLDHGRCSVFITSYPDCLWQILHLNPFRRSSNAVRTSNKQCKLPYALDQTELIIISSYCNPIQILVAMPFHNLEFYDSNDSSLGIYITSRLPVNSETVKLLTFTPPIGDSPKGMLVVVYWFLYPHSPRHQVFNPLDMPLICCLRLHFFQVIFELNQNFTRPLHQFIRRSSKKFRGQCINSEQIHKKVGEVQRSIHKLIERGASIILLCQFVYPRLNAFVDSWQDSLADACRDLDPIVDQPTLLVAVSDGALADSGSLPYLRLFDPWSGPAEGSSSLSSSSSCLLFRVTVSPYVSRMISSDS